MAISDFTDLERYTMTGSEVEAAIPDGTTSLTIFAEDGDIEVRLEAGATPYFVIPGGMSFAASDDPVWAGSTITLTGTASDIAVVFCRTRGTF